MFLRFALSLSFRVSLVQFACGVPLPHDVQLLLPHKFLARIFFGLLLLALPALRLLLAFSQLEVLFRHGLQLVHLDVTKPHRAAPDRQTGCR